MCFLGGKINAFNNPRMVVEFCKWGHAVRSDEVDELGGDMKVRG